MDKSIETESSTEENQENMDNFARLSRIILMNIKLVIENLAVKVFTSTPNADLPVQNLKIKQNPQLYLLLRMNQLELENNYEIKQQQLGITMKEITLHLLKEDMVRPPNTHAHAAILARPRDESHAWTPAPARARSGASLFLCSYSSPHRADACTGSKLTSPPPLLFARCAR